jgi:hypothetical protein
MRIDGWQMRCGQSCCSSSVVPRGPQSPHPTPVKITHTSTSGRERYVSEELRFYKDLQEGGEESREGAVESIEDRQEDEEGFE